MHSIEGRLLAIAESWPLQLTVQPDQGPPWSVRVGDTARLTLRGAPVQASALRTGQSLRVNGTLQGALGLQALNVEIT